MGKENNYAVMISSKISELFNEDSDLYINPEELEEGDNLTDFIYALSSLVPNMYFNNVTGDTLNVLQFNHTANQLIFQYAKKVDSDS